MWLATLAEEFGESAKEVLEKNDDLLLEELTQTVAVGLAWMEALIAKKEEESSIHEVNTNVRTVLYP